MADQQAKIVISAEDRSRAAFASAQRSLGNLEKGITRLSALPLQFAGITAALATLSASFELLDPRPMIALGDELAKLSQRSGIGVEKLDALRYAGQLADVEFDAMGKTLARLNINIAAAAAGEEEQADAFRKMGVAVVDANGKVRNQYDVLLDVADALSGYEDGANKVALVNAAMGKSGVAMIPLLNAGADAIRGSADELERLRGTIDPEFARRSEQFNDNMTKLGVAAERLKLSVAGGLLPGLVRYSEEAVAAARNSDLLAFSLRKVGDLFTGKLTRDVFGGSDQAPEAPPAAAPGKPKTEAPALDAPGAKAAAGKAAAERSKALAQALATERRVTERHLKAIAATQAAEQDALRFGEQYSRALYEDGVTSLEKYYADLDSARQQNLDAVRKAVAEEIAIREKEMKSPLLAGADKADEREAIATQIESARARLNAAEREADQAGQIAMIERRKAVEQLQDDVAALNAQIHDLATGSTVEADLLGIANRVRDANRLLLQAGASPDEAAARSQDLGARLTALQRLNKIRENFSDLTADAANAEQRLAATEQQRGDGLLESEARIRDVRTRALAELEKLIEATRELANQNPQNTPLQKYLADLETQALSLRAALDPTKLRLDQAANDIGATMAAGLERAAFEGGKFSDVLKQIGLDVLRITTNELVTKPAAAAFANIVKGAGGQGTGQNILGQLGSLLFGEGFDAGGYTGNVGAAQPAGIVHGNEYVFSAPATRAIGVRRLDAMHAAAKGGTRLPGYQMGGHVARGARRLPGYADGGFVRPPAAPGAAAPAAALQRPINVGPFVFHGAADPKTVQQAVLDGVRMAQRAGARGNA